MTHTHTASPTVLSQADAAVTLGGGDGSPFSHSDPLVKYSVRIARQASILDLIKIDVVRPNYIFHRYTAWARR